MTSAESAQHGVRRAPVALAISADRRTYQGSRGAVRFPITLAPKTSQWRLHIRNHNDRFDVSYTAGAEVTGIWAGRHVGGGAFADSPRRIHGPFTLLRGGHQFTSPWFTGSIGDGHPALLSLGWDADQGVITSAASGCFITTDPERARVKDSQGFTRAPFSPFSWWLEVETPVTTPVIAMWGDSLSTGTGNKFPVHDSPLAQYCRAIGAIPVHYAYPGTGMGPWTTPSARQWTRWSHLTRPDAAIHFMGTNDLLSAGSVANMQQRFMQTIEALRRNVSPNVHLATLLPSANKPPVVDAVRRAYNHWLSSRPGDALSTIDLATVVSDEHGSALKLAFDSGDGLHLSTAGSAALAAALGRHPHLPWNSGSRTRLRHRLGRIHGKFGGRLSKD